MRTKSKLHSIFFAICLIITSVCFNQVETDAFVVPYNTHNTTSCTIESDNLITSEDICTVEMLGNQILSLISQRAVTKSIDNSRKSEKQGALLISAVCLQLSFCIYGFAETGIVTDENGNAKTIQFIHNKDGKKKNQP